MDVCPDLSLLVPGGKTLSGQGAPRGQGFILLTIPKAATSGHPLFPF